jgi:hypothetical protein
MGLPSARKSPASAQGPASCSRPVQPPTPTPMLPLARLQSPQAEPLNSPDNAPQMSLLASRVSGPQGIWRWPEGQSSCPARIRGLSGFFC